MAQDGTETSGIHSGDSDVGNGARSRLTCRLATALALGALMAVAAPAWARAALFHGWVLSEFQPNIANGGRANTIAVHPTNSDIIFVASESGGLFRSTDGGATWHHIESLPQFWTNSVIFVPTDPNVVIVTTSEDFATANGGGIWRSTDGGTTWTHVASPPVPPGVSDRFSAFELSIAPDIGYIYAANNYGVAISGDKGATWTQADPFGGGDRRVFSVTAQNANHVIAGGPSGVRHSTDGGRMWHAPSASPGGIWDMHALGRSPFADDQAYVVNGNTELYYTEDAGDHWTKIASAPGGGGGCGGISFVKAVGRTVVLRPPLRRFVDLYFSNRCGMSRLTASSILGTGHFNYGGSWVALNADHGDTRDLAFTVSNQPLLLGTDGGLHKTTNGGLNWTFVGGGRNGYNALQITEVRGQWIDDVSRHDLYFGTQDNNLYSSSNTGASWTYGTCCEGFFIEGQFHVATAADSQVTFVACAGCGNYRSSALFAGIAGWSNPPGSVAGNPKIIAKSFHVQGVNAGGGFSKGLAVTTDLGASWQQYASFAEDRRDLPKHSWLPAILPIRPRLPVLYQPIRTGWDPGGGFEVNHLARIVKNRVGPGASVTYPAMNNFGGLGINPTMFAWYQVFAVDPGNANHLIAPDVVNQKMMQTFDGGDNWIEIPSLTSQVTDSGRLLFRHGISPQGSAIFPQVSAISFFPDDPNIVALGTWENGIFLSSDRGATWSKVPGSERVTYITSFDWRTARDVVISSYGRGLWRLNYSIIYPWPLLEAYCNVGCVIRPFSPPLPDPSPEQYEQAVLVFGGQIQGARVVDGMMKELFVRPGSSVTFVSNQDKAADIKLTETTRKVGFIGLGNVPAAPREATMITGLTMRRNGTLAGVIFAKGPLAMHLPERHAQVETPNRPETEERPVGREKSPVAEKPYLEVITGHVTGANAAAPGQTVQLAGRGHLAGSTIEIAIDGKSVERITVGQDGRFSATFEAPRQLGTHNITVVDQVSSKVIDGSMLLVRPEEKGGPNQEHERGPNRTR